MTRMKQKGFTIVELLIVIVVIGILAAVTIVAFNGVQQRATNTAKITGAQQTLKLIKAYVAENGTYPVANTVCATTDSVCTAYNGVVITASNSTLLTEIKKIGNPVESVSKKSSDTTYGLTYNYRSSMTFNGDATYRILFMFWLDGNNQQCGVNNVAVQTTGGTDPWISSTTGYTGNIGGQTVCYIAA